MPVPALTAHALKAEDGSRSRISRMPTIGDERLAGNLDEIFLLIENHRRN